MTGYMIVFGSCIGCGQMFGFNPHRVPSSSAVTGKREPICLGCVERLNPIRRKNGLAEIEVMDGAYEPAEDGA